MTTSLDFMILVAKLVYLLFLMDQFGAGGLGCIY